MDFLASHITPKNSANLTSNVAIKNFSCNNFLFKGNYQKFRRRKFRRQKFRRRLLHSSNAVAF